MGDKSEKRLARPRDSARGLHAYQNGRATLKHHEGPNSRVARPYHPVPTSMVMPHPCRRNLNAFRVWFSRHIFLSFREHFS